MSDPGALLPAAFYARDVRDVARDLLGRWVAHGDVVLRITETEAYCGPWDTAAHSRAGCTARTAPMFGPVGRAYVYLCYGIHQMLNIVAGDEGGGAAVLVRSAEPVAGMDTLTARRGGRSGRALTCGPGNVGAALAIDRTFNHHPLSEPGGLTVAYGMPAAEVRVGPRVGIGFASAEHQAAPWRYAIADSAWVTEARRLSPVAAGYDAASTSTSTSAG